MEKWIISVLALKWLAGVLVLALLAAMAVCCINRRRRILHRNRMLRSGLVDIGELAVETLRCTQAHSVQKARTLFGMAIPLTRAQYIFTYDVVVRVGFDFDQIDVQVNERRRTITLRFPPARVLSAAVEPDSLTILDERRSLFTRVPMESINEALGQMRDEAVARAMEEDIFRRAEASAQGRMQMFLGQFESLKGYRQLYVFSSGTQGEVLPEPAEILRVS